MQHESETKLCPECGEAHEPTVKAPSLRVFDVDVVNLAGVTETIQITAHAYDPMSSRAGHLVFIDIDETGTYWYRRTINAAIWRDVREAGSVKTGAGVH